MSAVSKSDPRQVAKPHGKRKRVFLGMSGGVDSSVSALLLKEQGYAVTGIYMKNWSEDLPGMKCPWAEDLADAKRVAVQLDLDFEVWDFEREYKAGVVDYMLAEFAKGRTPNPDVICNELIKFRLFADRAFSRGADYIATGHYAQAEDSHLFRAADENKDQTYFLYRIPHDTLKKTLFPIGAMKKPAVKALAAEHGLDVANKKESMGICFVGEVGMRDFLKAHLSNASTPEASTAATAIPNSASQPPVRPGEIREQETEKVLGYHDGAIFYTLGQRHGLYLGGGLPYYVVAKDLPKNIVYVSRNLNHPALWATSLHLTDLHWLITPSEVPSSVQVRLRHRAPLIPATLAFPEKPATPETERPAGSQEAILTFKASIKRPASGQSAVLYSGDLCLGGGIIE